MLKDLYPSPTHIQSTKHRTTRRSMQGTIVSQLNIAGAPAVQRFASDNSTYSSLLNAQNAALGVILDAIPTLQPTAPEPLTITGTSADVSAVVGSWQPSSSISPVRWVSASALANPGLQFGTTRLMSFVTQAIRCPHYVLELGVMGPTGRVQGTCTLAARSELLLDTAYLKTFYSTGANNSPSFDEIYDQALAKQDVGDWRRYTVAGVGWMKPVVANSISYTFPADAENIKAFAEIAVDVATLWVGLVKEEPPMDGVDESIARYDARHVQIVREDPGNAIAVKLFGADGTEKLVEATVGPNVA